MSEKELIKKICDEHCAAISEHVDSVQIFVTIHNGGEQTTSTYACGKGNFYARMAQTREWVVRQDEYVKENARNEVDNDTE